MFNSKLKSRIDELEKIEKSLLAELKKLRGDIVGGRLITIYSGNMHVGNTYYRAKPDKYLMYSRKDLGSPAVGILTGEHSVHKGSLTLDCPTRLPIGCTGCCRMCNPQLHRLHC